MKPKTLFSAAALTFIFSLPLGDGVFAQVCISTPVELLSFTAQCAPLPDGERAGVELQWSTASEQNSDYFSIERMSGKWWKPIGKVKCAGNSSVLLNYEFADEPPFMEGDGGILYYRLRQVDFNGWYKYYGPISVKCEPADEWDLILQNIPATDELQGTLFLSEDAQIRAEIFDLQGRKLICRQFAAVKGSNLIKFDLTNISGGFYFITISNAKKQRVKKFVKQ